MANVMEMLGLRDVAIEDAAAEYVRLWDVLRRVKEGEIEIGQVVLRIAPNGQRTWEVKDKLDDQPEKEGDYKEGWIVSEHEA